VFPGPAWFKSKAAGRFVAGATHRFRFLARGAAGGGGVSPQRHRDTEGPKIREKQGRSFLCASVSLWYLSSRMATTRRP